MTKPLETILTTGIVVFILILPWQTHYEFIPGINNITTINIYGFDLLLIALLLIFAWHWYHLTNPVNWPLLIVGLGIMTLTLCSAYWAEDRSVAIYFWLHLTAGLGLIALIAHCHVPHRVLGWAIITSGLMQTTVVIWQWCTQTVTAAKWLGLAEQLAWQSGPAVVVTAAGRWLRAYGTMPHPNGTAAWLLLAWLSVLWLGAQKLSLRERNWLFVCAAVLTAGLILTFSRAALLMFIVALIIGWFVTLVNRPLIVLATGTLLLMTITLWPLLSSRINPQPNYVEQLSITERGTQYKQATKLLAHYWPTGTGLGQYTIVGSSKTDTVRQPLHNVPLLTVIELGIFGAVVWYSFIGYVINRGLAKVARTHSATYWLGISLCILIGLSLLDHYFWTNFSLFFGFCLILGLTLNSSKTLLKHGA